MSWVPDQRLTSEPVHDVESLKTPVLERFIVPDELSLSPHSLDMDRQIKLGQTAHLQGPQRSK